MKMLFISKSRAIKNTSYTFNLILLILHSCVIVHIMTYCTKLAHVCRVARWNHPHSLLTCIDSNPADNLQTFGARVNAHSPESRGYFTFIHYWQFRFRDTSHLHIHVFGWCEEDGVPGERTDSAGRTYRMAIVFADHFCKYWIPF